MNLHPRSSTFVEHDSPHPRRNRGPSVAWALLAAATSALAVPLGAQEQEAWSIEESRAPSTTPLRFVATEGTWMSIDVAPDGQSIVFDLLGHLYEMPIEGGEARALTTGRSWNILPRYSPDGTRIAFTSDRSGTEDIWVLHRAQDSLENVSDLPGPVVRGSWAANGTALYASAQGEDWGTRALRFNLYGDAQELVSGPTFQPITSFQEHGPSGRVFFEHLDGQLYQSGARIKAYDLETGEVEVYRERPGGAFNPTLSPDGRFMAYGHRDDLVTVVILHDLETREEREILRDLDRDHQEYAPFYYGVAPAMAWHPDGSELFVAQGGKIRAVNVETGATREIPFRAPVDRELDQAIRFPFSFPEGTARAKAYRWAHRTDAGIVFEALGDIWLRTDSETRQLTATDAHETSPLVDHERGLLYYATWSDDTWGQIHRRPLAGGTATAVTTVPSQYSSLALASDGTLAFIRGAGQLMDGARLEAETRFELVTVDRTGVEATIVDVSGTANSQGRHPFDVRFGDDGEIYFTEFLADTLVLQRIGRDGTGKTALVRFPHGEQAALSPDLRWIAFREYHRSYVTPLDWIGKTLTVSGYDGQAFTARIDGDDGSYLAWSNDSTVSWPRGGLLYEKTLSAILAGSVDPVTTDIGVTYDVATPGTTLALTNARVITMDGDRAVLDGATIVVEGNRIADVGANVQIPTGARVFDLAGSTVMPGMVDAHAHPDPAPAPTHVVEQRLPGILAGLAHGVTTLYELYGSEEKDPWVFDMIAAGKMDGPRLLTVGAPMYGLREFRPKTYRPIASYEDAAEHVRYARDQGVPALKDYVNFSRADRHQLAAAARDHGLNLVAETAGTSHMNFTQIVDGFTGLEHSMGVTPLYQDVIELFRASSIGVTPTLLVVYNGPTGQSLFDQTNRVWENEKLLRFSTEEQLRTFRRVLHYWDDDLYAPEMAAAMKRLFDAGVLVNAGGHGQMLGLDMHWELELLVQGGFSPMDALQVATRNGATYHGLGADLGSIEAGKLADLVVLRSNPLDDIRNTRTIRYVIKDGIVYDGDDASRIYPGPEAAPPFYFQRR